MTQEEFYGKISEWISQDKTRWNHITLMAYFCHKYEQKNKARFRLVRWKEDPGKGKESRDFSKLFNIFAPEDYNDLDQESRSKIKLEIIQKIYNYINWMFDYKFRSGERSVNGTQLFLMPAMINEFERMYQSFVEKNSKKDNFKLLVDELRISCPKIFDHHQIDDISDLKILEKYIINYNLSEDSIESTAVSIAKKMGVIL